MDYTAIPTGGIGHLAELEGSGGWYWGSDFAQGDLYEAEELYRDGHPIRCNRLIFVHAREAKVHEPLPPREGCYFGPPLYDGGTLVVLRADFPAGALELLRYDPATSEVTPIVTLPRSAVKDCYNLMPSGWPLMLTRQAENTFQILWPLRAEFPMGHTETFYFRRGDELVCSRWFEDPDYREETVVRRFPDGAVLSVHRAASKLLPDGRLWLLEE